MIGPTKPFNTINTSEAQGVWSMIAAKRPLSGYLAGKERGGYYVSMLEDEWAATFHVKHAVACNSATSGLLAAAFAAGIGAGDHFVCPAMTMSATAAAPMFTGAIPYFVDVEDETFGLAWKSAPDTTKAIFSVNLFGHPSRLGRNEWYKNCGIYLIEDNSQSPFSMAHGRYCGTMGHMGVWSLNIHKPIHCGEGGVVTTDDDDLAQKLRNFINHGENVGDRFGLNLRMPEVCAVIALNQLRKGEEIVDTRIKQALEILSAIGPIDGLTPPETLAGCKHVYYTIPFVIDRNREGFCRVLTELGVPVVEGYIDPLYRLPAFHKFARHCPIAEELQDEKLFYIENCAYDFTGEQIVQIGEAFKNAAELAL